MKYSLANYILGITPKDPEINSNIGSISIGGEGDYIGSVSVSRNKDMFTTTGYNTGAWVHNKNLDRTGTVSIDLNQLAPQVKTLINLSNLLYVSQGEGLDITLTDISGNKVCDCIDCYITRIPEQAFSNEAANQSWSFTCGQIDFAI